MTIVPNLLVTRTFAILFFLIFLVWVTMFVQRKNGGLVLILLSIVIPLVGGGIFPPIIGIIIGTLLPSIAMSYMLETLSNMLCNNKLGHCNFSLLIAYYVMVVLKVIWEV
jgi:uncharacterized membrane protein YccC